MITKIRLFVHSKVLRSFWGNIKSTLSCYSFFAAVKIAQKHLFIEKKIKNGKLNENSMVSEILTYKVEKPYLIK